MNILRQQPISRRTVLRGAGVALGLPWLEAMMPSRAVGASKSAAAPIRMAVLYMANGVNTAKWTPEGQGKDFTFSPTLEPLRDFKDQTLVISNLWNAAANTGDGHYVKESSLLTCTTISKTLGIDINMHGVSMDQVAAQRVGEQTPLASLELGIEPESTGVDTNVGYTRVYGCHIAWSNPTTPLAREINPLSVYERLFRAAGSTGRCGEAGHTAARPRARPRQEDAGPTSERPIRPAWTNISRSCGPLKLEWSAASDPKRNTWKPRVSLDCVPKPTDNPNDPSGARSSDARSDRAGLPKRHNPHQHVYVRQCGQRSQLPFPRRRDGLAP